jgi:ribosomal protein S18 acetylase RimI-like enzyme
VEIRPFLEGDRAAVVALWEICGLIRPWNDPGRDIDRKVVHDPDGFVVGEADGQVVATAMFGYDGHRGSVFYLAVHPELQGGGLGRALMDHIEHRLEAIGCPKVNVMVRHDNEQATRFYERLGYSTDAVTGLGKRLITDERP